VKGKDVRLTAHYAAGFFCDARRLGVFDREVFSTRIHLTLDAPKEK